MTANTCAWTPGPWRVTKPDNKGEVFVKDCRVPPQLVTSAVQGDNVHGAIANANLIAAGPDLYTALEVLLEAYEAAIGKLMDDYVRLPVDEWPEPLTGCRTLIESSAHYLAAARGES